MRSPVVVPLPPRCGGHGGHSGLRKRSNDARDIAYIRVTFTQHLLEISVTDHRREEVEK